MDRNGNGQADLQAKAGAKSHRVPSDTRRKVEVAEAVAFRAALELGVTTYAANNHETQSVATCGKVVTSFSRDCDGLHPSKRPAKKVTIAESHQSEMASLADPPVAPSVTTVKLTYLAKRAAVTAAVAVEKINKEVERELVIISNAMLALERSEDITTDAQAAEDRNVRRKVEQGVDDAMDLTGEPDSNNSFAPRRRQDRPRPNRKDAGPVRLAVVKAKAAVSSSVKPMLSKSSISTAVQRMKDAVSGAVTPAPVHTDGISPFSVRNWDPQSEGALSNSSLPTCIGETPVNTSVSSSSTGTRTGDLFTPASASEQQKSHSEPSGLTRCTFEKPKTQQSSCSSSSQARTTEAKTAKAKSASSSTPVNKQLNKDIMSLLQ